MACASVIGWHGLLVSMVNALLIGETRDRVWTRDSIMLASTLMDCADARKEGVPLSSVNFPHALRRASLCA